MTRKSRARTLEEFSAKFALLRSAESQKYAQAFSPRADDVIIATFPKAGTTWMQQIVHGLRSSGDMSFGEITAAVPWIEMAYDLELSLECDQAYQPRAFKSHDPWELAAKGCRHIYVIRDSMDSAVSWYNFINGWVLEPGAITVDSFINATFLQDIEMCGYWHHLLSWWNARDETELLMLCYEDMLEDLPAAVAKVADFMGITNEQAISIATEQASFAYMSYHDRQFDDHLVRDKRNAVLGLPEEAASTKVRFGGRVSARQVLSVATIAKMEQAWQQTIGKALGFADYPALRSALAAN